MRRLWLYTGTLRDAELTGFKSDGCTFWGVLLVLRPVYHSVVCEEWINMEYHGSVAAWSRRLLLLSLLSIVSTAMAQGPICRVNGGGSGGPGSSWANAYQTLQDALAVAACTEIWVAQGVYYPSSSSTDVGASFNLTSGVEIYGGFAGTESNRGDRNSDPATNLTILSGDIGQDDATQTEANVIDDPINNPSAFSYNFGNSGRVVVASGVDSTAILDGFTITAGSGIGTGSAFTPGAGIFISSDASPILRNLRIRGNAYYSFAVTPEFGDGGGGVYIQNSNPSFENVEISNNYTDLSGGGLYNDGTSTPQLRDVSFIGNSADSGGGGMFNSGSPSLINVAFKGNLASSENNIDYPSHTALGGGFLNDPQGEVSVVLANVLFSGNKAVGHGGGLYNSLGDIDITNTTFATNQADRGGAIFHQSTASLFLRNSILWENDATDTSNQGEEIYNNGIIEVSDSIINGGIGGSRIDGNSLTDQGGNGSSDPSFISPESVTNTPTAEGDYQLNASSPARNIGDGTAFYDNINIIASIDTDLAGNARLNGCIDLGPYEEGTATSQSCLVIIPPLDNGGNEIGTVTRTGGIDCGLEADPDVCQESITTGSSVTLNASTTNPSIAFIQWTGDCSGTSNPLTINPFNDDRVCGVEFGTPQNTFTLTITEPTDGTVTGSGLDCGTAGGGPCSVDLAENASVSLTFAADAGARFVSWTGPTSSACDGSTDNPLVFTLTADLVSCGVTTETGTTLTINPEPVGGTVTGNGLNCGTGGDVCEVFVLTGTDIDLLATPDGSESFQSWGGGCSGTDADLAPFSPGSATSVSCSATFSTPVYTLTIDPEPVGATVTATVDGNPSVLNCGVGGDVCSIQLPQTGTNAVALSITTETGFTFNGWSGGCSTDPFNLNENLTCTASVTSDNPQIFIDGFESP